MAGKTCHRCGGRMGEVFLLDDTHGGYRDTQWVEGAPVKSLWLGLKIKLPVASYRC